MKVSDFDFSNFEEYARRFHGDSDTRQAPYKELLPYWEENKNKYLWDLMGHELIKSRRFRYSATDEDILQKMEEFVDRWSGFVDSFLDAIYKYFQIERYHRPWFREEDSEVLARYKYCEAIIRAINNADCLMATRFGSSVSCLHPTSQKKFSIMTGQKIMKTLNELAQAVNMKEEFEEFRIAHSQVLNQKTITGELVLSIHPLDFATASDNENGWTSCMSWREEGCYRLGTVEMMNSPMVLVAYVKSDTQEMSFGNYIWPSKKWRAWIIVDEKNRQIFANKHYPYQCQAIAAEAVNWVAELANENLHWNLNVGTAELMDYDPENYDTRYTTHYMYNDFNYQRNMHIGETPLKLITGHGRCTHNVCYSGPANCMCCGDLIDWEGDTDRASSLLCNHCDGRETCYHCGCLIDRDNIYYDSNGNTYCEGCFNDLFSHCDQCDESIPCEEVYSHALYMNHDAIRVAEKEYGMERRFNSDSVQRYTCRDCLRDNHCQRLIDFNNRVTIDGRAMYLDPALDLSDMSAEDLYNSYDWRYFYRNLIWSSWNNDENVRNFFEWLRNYMNNFYTEVKANPDCRTSFIYL